MKKITLVILSVALLVFMGHRSIASPPLGALHNVGNRYLIDKKNPDKLLYWGEPISFQAIGNREEIYASNVRASLAVYAGLADAAISDQSDAKSQYNSSSRRVLPTTNYLIVFSDAIPVKAGAKEAPPKTITLPSIGLDISDANPVIQELSSRGLPQQQKGCFIGMKLNSNGEISGMAAVVDTSLRPFNRDQCVNRLIVSSFGVSPLVNSFNISLSAQPGRTIPFANNSESVLAVEVSRYCRKEWKIPTVGCARGVLDFVLGKEANFVNSH